jgi:hypothetical protein
MIDNVIPNVKSYVLKQKALHELIGQKGIKLRLPLGLKQNDRLII